MDLSGTWYNQLNSTMVISVRPDGSLTGSYVSGVGGSAASLLVRQSRNEHQRGLGHRLATLLKPDRLVRASVG